ncbi:MAG: hypothetical protein AAFY98_11445 [Verrucomicrobiota bacterium]
MKTLVAMISVGPRKRINTVSIPRATRWAYRNGYDFSLIREPLQSEHQPPHYGKLYVPEAFPDYDRYCIIDDDLLIASAAPELPLTPEDHLALAPDAEQRHTRNPKVKWTGNTGFIVARKGAIDLMLKAQSAPEDPTVWGYADQGVLNSVAWSEDRVTALDKRWNYAPVLEYFLQGEGWDSWRDSRRYRFSFYFKAALRSSEPVLQSMRDCWGLHMIRATYPRFFNWVLN